MEIGGTIGVSMLSAVVASFLAYFFGFRQYLKQRQREEIIDYYVKNGIDVVIKSLDEASFNCRFNFGKAMRIVEYLEKSCQWKGIEKNLVSEVFSEMRPLVVAPPDALYKIQILIGEKCKTISKWVIEALADYLRYNDYLRYELFLETQIYFQFPEQFKSKEKKFIADLRISIVEINQIIWSYEKLKVHLFNIRARIDEIGVATMKDFDKNIYKDKRIKEILQEIEKDYGKLDFKV
jgi:hypothetical protein